MSMSSKIEPTSRPLQTGWAKAAFLAAGVIAYQLLVYSMIVGQPDGGIGELLMAAPLVVVVGCVLGRTWRGRALLLLLTAAGVLGFLLWRTFGASPALFYPVPYITVYLFLLGCSAGP